jgi:outer membrane protein
MSPLCLDGFNPNGEVKMLTRMAFWRTLVAAVFLVAVSIQPAVGQGDKKDSGAEEATHLDYSTSRSFPNILSPYFTRYVPRPRLDNSPRLQDLISNSKLNLTIDDAIALALENNLDVEVARYNLPIGQTDFLRAKGGGAVRGVAGSFQSTTAFSGALGGAGNSGNGGGGGGAGGTLGGGIYGGGTVSCCDPSVYAFYGWSNSISPLNYTVVSGVPVESTHQAYFQAGYGQGFLTGTSLTVSEYSYRLSSNATTALYNPDFVSGLSVGFSQNLLAGYGYRANARSIRQGRNNLRFAMSVFRQAVITQVAAVMSTYYDLLADAEKIHVAQEGLQNAQKLLENNQTELKIGAVAQYDVLRSQEEVALRKQDLLKAGNTFSQDAQSLKAKISKSFNQELARVDISPTDKLPEPRPDDVPSLDEAMKEAEHHRPEIEQADINLLNQQYNIQETRNELLPQLQVFASYNLSGLGGALRPTFANIFQNDFPNISYGVQLGIPFRNRVAQADAARALLEQRQLQMKLQDATNQAVWDVNKAVSAVQQAKAQLDAATNLEAISRQVLGMQQQKFTLASATVEEVITAQTNLANAQGAVVTARAAYAKALIQFEQATGTLLDRNHIDLTEAVQGEVKRTPNIPGAPVN